MATGPENFVLHVEPRASHWYEQLQTTGKEDEMKVGFINYCHSRITSDFIVLTSYPRRIFIHIPYLACPKF